jgi:hypothetical protein
MPIRVKVAKIQISKCNGILVISSKRAQGISIVSRFKNNLLYSFFEEMTMK